MNNYDELRQRLARHLGFTIPAPRWMIADLLDENEALRAALDIADARLEGIAQYARRYGEAWVISSAGDGHKEIAKALGDAS